MKKLLTLVAIALSFVALSLFDATEAYAAGETVNWCLYNDGALVINGDNEESYNGHEGILADGIFDTSQNYGQSWPWGGQRAQIESIEFAKLTTLSNMSYMFRGCVSLTNIDFSNLDTSMVTDASYMFKGCSSLQSLAGLEKMNVHNVTDMSYMFSNCTALQDLTSISGWDTGNVTTMSRMFVSCRNLQNLSGLEDWDTHSLSDMSYMFNSNDALTNISAMSEWKTNEVTTFYMTFNGCYSLNDISALKEWQTGNVTNMSFMFQNCWSLTYVSALNNWDVGSVTSMQSMFNSCRKLRVIDLYSWSLKRDTNITSLFDNCSNLKTIVCPNSWEITSSNVFRYCSRLKAEPSGITYTINKISGNMCNPNTGYFSLRPDATYTPTIQKKLLDAEGNTIDDWYFPRHPFTFEIVPVTEDAPLPDVTAATTDAEGNVTWPEIWFYGKGEYTYQITELKGTAPGISYDSEPGQLTIKVG